MVVLRVVAVHKAFNSVSSRKYQLSVCDNWNSQLNP